MAFDKVFVGTAVASALSCLLMGFLANLPFALSASMGVNAMFAYTVCISMGYSWKWALSAVFVEGIIFILLTLTNVREEVIRCIPPNLKKAIGAGVGLFIAYIGLKNAGLIVSDEASLTILSPEWYKGAPGLAAIGLIITGVLLARNVKGALLIGLLFCASLFLSPVFASIPSAATAPALIIVGVMMITPIKDIDYDDFTEAIPAFLTMIFMICASNMADGIMMGILSYALLKLLTGRKQEIDVMTYGIAAFYLLKIILDLFF